MSKAEKNSGTPSVIVLDTIKGHGWSGGEGQVGSHSRGLSEEELANALEEIRRRYNVQ